MPDFDKTSVHEFASVREISPLALMDGLRVRPINGERITLAVFELDPGVAMPEHRHPNEQVGVVVRGEFAGEAGCTIVETFSPPRDDWSDTPRREPSADRWPPP